MHLNQFNEDVDFHFVVLPTFEEVRNMHKLWYFFLFRPVSENNYLLGSSLKFMHYQVGELRTISFDYTLNIFNDLSE